MSYVPMCVRPTYELRNEQNNSIPDSTIVDIRHVLQSPLLLLRLLIAIIRRRRLVNNSPEFRWFFFFVDRNLYHLDRDRTTTNFSSYNVDVVVAAHIGGRLAATCWRIAPTAFQALAAGNRRVIISYKNVRGNEVFGRWYGSVFCRKCRINFVTWSAARRWLILEFRLNGVFST